ncbi:MAG: hypothetical protein EZS28_056213, partial [Streblomastix strix]
IPYSVPQQIIIDTIRESAFMFYRYGYGRAQENKMFYLPLDEIHRYGNVTRIDDVNSHYPMGDMGIYAGTGTLWDYPDYSPQPHLNSRYHNPKTGFLGYSVKLPGFVNIVYGLEETNNNRTFSALSLIQNMQYMGQQSPYGQSLVGINSSLYLIEAVCKLVEGQALE